MDWRDRKGNQHGPVENNDQKRRNSELEAFSRLWAGGDGGKRDGCLWPEDGL